MPTRLGRREFLVQSAGLAASVGFVTAVGSSHAAAPAALPVGCRDVHLKYAGASDCWAAMKQLGAECVEVVLKEDMSLPSLVHPQKQYSLATPAGVAQVRDDAAAAGVRISALCMSNQFDVRPDMEVEWCGKAARACAALGVKAIRIDVVVRKLKPDQFLDFSVETLKKVMAASATAPVSFGVENHGRITNDPAFLRPLFERVGSNRLGLTLDTGNFYWFGHPLAKLYGLYEEFAPRVVHTHCKSIGYPADQRDAQRKMGWEYGKYNCPITKGDIDFARVVAILKKAGYQNDLCIENESLEKLPAAERGPALAGELTLLKSLRG